MGIPLVPQDQAGKTESEKQDCGLGLDEIHNSYDIASIQKKKIHGQKSDMDLQPSTLINPQKATFQAVS